jgi:hypothetical protein
MIKATLPPERAAAKDKTDIKGILKFTKVNLETLKKQRKKIRP